MEESHIRVLVCPNAFKGSLTAIQAAQAMAEGLERASSNRQISSQTEAAAKSIQFEAVPLPLADGGDGTLETLVEATGGSIHRLTVRGPLGMPVEAAWGRLGGDRNDTAVIEMAQASGLRLLRPEQYDPLNATTYGTGELMRAAVAAGCRRLLIGIGGSATNDGGAGMAQALGARLLDSEGKELAAGGAVLSRLAHIDRTHWLLPTGTQVQVACDVDNPLYGPEGAAAVYGPQKGANPDMVRTLDAALAHYASVLETRFGKEVANQPGAGAAGGLGAGLLAFCGAMLLPGTEMVLEATGFEARLRTCRLALTGEGRLDRQTARGKVIAGVARHALAVGVPCVALVGALEEGAEALLRSEGLTAAWSILDGPRTVEAAMADAYRLLMEASERLARFWTLWL